MAQIAQHMDHQDIGGAEAVIGEPVLIPQGILKFAQPLAQVGFYLGAALGCPSLFTVEEVYTGQFGNERLDAVHGGEQPWT